MDSQKPDRVAETVPPKIKAGELADDRINSMKKRSRHFSMTPVASEENGGGSYTTKST
jgi:hypothetical protein